MTGKNFVPFPVLKTERLTLRQLESSDDNEIFALRSNVKINKYLERKSCKSIEDARNFIQIMNENIQRNDSFYWAITLKGTDKLIGTICFFDFSKDYSKIEIGYELLPEFQGRGIMQEATSKVINFGFQYIGTNSIEAYTHSENQSSRGLLEKFNFRKDNDAADNFMKFKLTRNDWKKSNEPLI